MLGLTVTWIATLVLVLNLAVSLEGLVDATRSRRDVVNLMEKVEDKCNGNEECLRATYRKLEESIGVYSGDEEKINGLPSSWRFGDDSVKSKSGQDINKLNHMVEESNEELEHELDDLRAMFDEIKAMSESGNPTSTGVGDSYRKGEFEQFDKIKGSVVNGRDSGILRLQEDGSNVPESSDGLIKYPAMEKLKDGGLSGDKARKLADVNWGDIWSLGEEETARWKQGLRAKLEKAKAERKKERDELKRQQELIRDSKKELQHYQTEMLNELEEEIRELQEEEAELLKEKEEIIKEISKNVKETADEDSGTSFFSTEPQFRK